MVSALGFEIFRTFAQQITNRGHHLKTRNDKAPLGGNGRTTRRPCCGFRHEEIREAQQGL